MPAHYAGLVHRQRAAQAARANCGRPASSSSRGSGISATTTIRGWATRRSAACRAESFPPLAKSLGEEP